MSNPSPRGVAVVTGASTGIGAIYADRLAKRGHDLILVARNAQRLDALATRLKAETGRKVTALAADLGEKTELAKVEAMLRNDPAITMLVNNAGMGSVASILQAADLVDAALAGLDQGELVTIPGLHEGEAWTRWEQGRRDLAPKFRNPKPAPRYQIA